jgi:hypothetical protein
MGKPGKAHMSNVIAYLRQHALAVIALVFSLLSLGGASYAAFSLPAASVGNRQLKDGAITAAKLNPTSIAASVRAWATLTWTGIWRVQASTSDIQVRNIAQGEVVTWKHTRFARNCIASVTPARSGGTSTAIGSVTTSFDPSAGVLEIDGFSPINTSQPQSANILIVCPSPGSQKANG